ncbi:MAG: aminotransferase class I/II-fold pyridoxal phosphate-dependent enzyme, partial [Geobacteraceae bacterium]|nr:aminotransferase class I/II-fold pyridoxal phosphate-dependent enzyme [Geobacteraceae bacterium]
MKIATRIIHTGHETDPHTGALSVPIYQTSTFAQESVDHFGKYDYARSGNPTREALEETVALLEGGSHGFAFASGMAAISSALLLFSPGDHLVVCEDVYGGTFRVLTRLFSRLGIESTFVDATDLSVIEAAIRPETKGIYLETPSNPLLKITDLRGAAQLAKARGILTLVDNTFMTPYFQRPLELGCDIVLHSGTKFLNGHSDVICGFAVVADQELASRIRFIQNGFGAVLGPQDSWLVLRGLKTLKVRMEESQASAVKIANWLAGQQRVTNVFFPGLPGHPGYAVHNSQSSGPGAVLSFTLESYELTK